MRCIEKEAELLKAFSQNDFGECFELNDINEEKEEIQPRILAANKAYSSLQTIF
jgi:hypothetical protein